MKLDSEYFDSIRVKPDSDRLQTKSNHSCEYEDCSRPGLHKAPKGRGQEGEYFIFCVDHVREYNKKYDYFSDMQEHEIKKFQKSAMTGHRPTWKVSDRDSGKKSYNKSSAKFGFLDIEEDIQPKRQLRNAERKALSALGLDETATANDIKTQYKSMVKRLHPDTNGGNRDFEDKLMEAIKAYDYLKSVGFCE